MTDFDIPSRPKTLAEITAGLLESYQTKGNLTSDKIKQVGEMAAKFYKQRRTLAAKAKPKLILPNVVKVAAITKRQSRILDVAAEIQATPAKEAGTLVFMAKPFVQTTLPHRDPGQVNEWVRRNGKVAMAIRPGFGDDPMTGERICYGLPYGTVPRLILIELSTIVTRSKSRYVELGSLYACLKRLGLDPKHRGINSPAYRFMDQFNRMLHSIISINQNVAVDDKLYQRFMHMIIAQEGCIEWCPRNSDIPKRFEKGMKGSWIKLSESFYKCLTSSSVPLDDRILAEVKHSSLGLDSYAWMEHRGYSAEISGKGSFITWQQMHDQFGCNYSKMKDFKKEVKPYIRTIKSMSRHIAIDEADGGLKISKKFTVVS